MYHTVTSKGKLVYHGECPIMARILGEQEHAYTGYCVKSFRNNRLWLLMAGR